MSTDSEALGGPAEEARRLVEALGEWAAARLGAADEHLATGSAECLVCPVCQLISALRGDRPEMLARLGEAWTAFVGVLSHAHPPAPAQPPPDKQTHDEQSHDEQTSVAGAASTGSAPVRPVQNIDVR